MNQPLVMVTCYDVTFSKLLSDPSLEIDYLLVGDSVGMVLYGDSQTTSVSLTEMERHTKAVARGRAGTQRKPEIIADLPVGTFERPELAVASAHRLCAAGAEWVKVEGPVYDSVQALRNEGIRVCGHVGLTPQSISEFKVQGREPESAERIFQEACELEKAGVELLVLEMVPVELSERITKQLRIPTIGIGAGSVCRGQVLVLYDLLGLNEDFHPKFLKKFADGGAWVRSALTSYAKDVRARQYPGEEHSFHQRVKTP